MRMTDTQAAEYCDNKARNSLNGTPSGEQASRNWNRLYREIEQDGLDAVEERENKWREKVQADRDPRHTADTRVTDEFLEAIYDDDKVNQAIAGELLEKVEEEISKQNTIPLRFIYLQKLRDHLEYVVDGTEKLQSYHEVKEEVNEELRKFEEEYGAWVDEAPEYGDGETEKAVARELQERVIAEIGKLEYPSLRAFYLGCLRNHFGNVLSDAADLVDYEKAREYVETQVLQLEKEYGKWINDAILAQEV